MYVRALLQQAAVGGAILLPQQAVQRSQQGDSVKVVGADGMVETRPVKVGSGKDGQWVVLSGLKDGEQVVVDGFQKMQGKAPVKPVPWTAPGAVNAPAAAGSAPAPAAAASAAAKS
jgi:membrane fusion protein (multidrug efflux system)